MRLIYIHAGAGYGKTTLLAQYAAGRAGIVWLSAQESDGDVLTFLGHLEGCVRRSLPRVDFHAGDYVPYSGGEGLVPAALSAFLRATSGSRLTFVLDDAHFLTQESQRFLVEWAKTCPPEHTLIMSSRTGLPGRLLRLKLDGRIAVLTRDDLAFTRDEAGALWGAPCEPAYNVTEGWPLAVQSYRMAALGNPDISVAGLGASEELFHYLADEILLRLAPVTQDFLLRTYLLPELDAATCDCLLGSQGSRDVLEDLVQRDIFTMRVSDGRYRYHSLFKLFLSRMDDGRGPQTLRNAALRLAESGDHYRAIDYAVLTGDADLVNDLLEKAPIRPFGTGDYRRLQAWLDFLEAQRAPLSPRVLLMKGLYLSSRGAFSEADRCLSAALGGASTEEDIVYLYAMLHRARILRNKASLGESTALLDQVIHRLEGQPMAVWYAVAIEKVYNLILASRLSEARELVLSMAERCSVEGDVRVKEWFLRYLTAICFYEGDFAGTIRAYEKSLKIPPHEQDWLRRHCVGLYAAKAYQMVGDEAMALQLIEAELERVRELGLTEELSLHYLMYAEILGSIEMRKVYAGEDADFEAFDRYAGLAEEYATLNRGSRDYSVLARALRMSVRPFRGADWASAGGRADNGALERDIEGMLPLIEEIAPLFRTLAYLKIAGALSCLGSRPELAIEIYERCIEIGESIGSYCYSPIAYGELAAIRLGQGDEQAAIAAASKYMELSKATGQRYTFTLRSLSGPVLRLALDHGITPEFTREMVAYGGYKTRRVYIHTLGKFYIAAEGSRDVPVKIRTRKARELLAYLLEHRGGASRQRIHSDLWEDSEADIPRLFHTRRGEIKRAFATLGAGNPVLRQGNTYFLCTDEIVCDADALREAISVFKRHPSLKTARQVVDLHTGRYLEDMEALWAEDTRLDFEDAFKKAKEMLRESHQG